MSRMPDYRAHKLFWILRLPLALAASLSRFVVITIAIVIAQSTSYGPFVKIGIAYVAFELISLLLVALLASVSWVSKRGFFWLIDVVPAHGANQEEAQDIALRGRIAELEIKLKTNFTRWTPDDTDEMVSLGNWRARFFFGGRIRRRLQRRITEYKHLYEDFVSEYGKSGDCELDYAEMTELKKRLVEADNRVPDGKPSWFEKIIVTQSFFNSIIATILIVIVINYVAPHGHF